MVMVARLVPLGAVGVVVGQEEVQVEASLGLEISPQNLSQFQYPIAVLFYSSEPFNSYFSNKVGLILACGEGAQGVKIVNGEMAGIGEFPWMAALVRSKKHWRKIR